MIRIQNEVGKGQTPNHEDLTSHIKEFGLKAKGIGFYYKGNR